MTGKHQSAGRDKNAAQPLGERSGLVSKKGTARTGERSTEAAGPDGPDAKEAAKIVK
jgi:hypothetical protein